jgi:hypothetical protein
VIRVASSVLCLSLLACSGGSLKRPSDKNVNLTGTVFLGGAERRGDPLEAATVTVTRALDGSVLATATSSATGGWRLTFAAERDTQVVVAFRAPNLVPNFRGLFVGPFTEAQLSVALEPPEGIECADNQCVGGSDELSISEVPDNLIGRARVFEPSTQTPRLLGLEALRPIVVAWYQLDAGPAIDAGEVDDAGLALVDGGTSVSGPAVLRVRIPFAAWRRVEDAKPGTAAIEVPFLSFDEVKGVWNKEAEGILETEFGMKIPESALAKVREGMFPGGVVAVAAVRRAGYWTIALPAAAPGCLTGKIEADGQSAEGALLSLEGAQPATSHADGTFCIAAPLNAGGQLGVQYAGLGYQGGMATAPAAPGVCGGSCTAVGTIAVKSEALAPAKLCKFSGKTVDGAGTAVTGAVVLGFDDSVNGNTLDTLCGKLGTRCTLSTSSDAKGEFTLNLPLLTGMTLTSTALVEKAGFVEASRRGSVLLRECPVGVMQLRLLAGHDKLDLSLTLSGTSISWAPVRPAVSLRAIDALGAVKWEIESLAGLGSPVTYGVLPPGAVQRVPAAGAPAALVKGDEVSVILDGTGGDGYQYSGGAAATVP